MHDVFAVTASNPYAYYLGEVIDTIGTLWALLSAVHPNVAKGAHTHAVAAFDDMQMACGRLDQLAHGMGGFVQQPNTDEQTLHREVTGFIFDAMNLCTLLVNSLAFLRSKHDWSFPKSSLDELQESIDAVLSEIRILTSFANKEMY